MSRFNSKAPACSKGLFIGIWFYFFYLRLCCVYWPTEHRKEECVVHEKGVRAGEKLLELLA